MPAAPAPAAPSIDTGSNVTTRGALAYGLVGQSIGGGGGTGGFAFSAAGSAGESIGGLSLALGGLGGGTGGTVDLISRGNIRTFGQGAHGVIGQSLGGGGGNGGAGNSAALVKVTTSGTVITSGEAAYGVVAQSIGGGGGDGGWGMAISGGISSESKGTLVAAIGGSGGTGGTGGEVQLRNSADVTTQGSNSFGLVAQSIGSGGGNGGAAYSGTIGGTDAKSLSLNVGGFGGAGGKGGVASVLNQLGGSIETTGAFAHGIESQSIGGGGGSGGAAITAIMGISSTDPEQSKSRTVNIAVAVGGLGGNGSYGGAVSVKNTGTLITWGGQSKTIQAQSIGGGGGEGGHANTISLQVAAACTLPLVCDTPDNAKRNINLQASVGGNGGGASDGGAVDVDNGGVIVTHGQMADGILAQSIGGGGGEGGNGTLGTTGLQPVPVEVIFLPVGMTPIYQDINVAVGGNAGAQGNGGAVTVLNTGAITTLGSNAVAIKAQSIGGGGGEGGVATVGLTGKVGIGGKGGAGGNGSTVLVTNKAALSTSGSASYGIFAQSVGGGGGRAGNVDRGFASLLGNQYGLGIGLVFGQGGGDGGDGAAVTVDNQSAITTTGIGAIGLFAQSVGGGGGQLGNIGNFDVSGLLGFFVGSIGDRGNGGLVTVKQSGNISTGGIGAVGLFAQSAGGQGTGDAVNVELRGNITTLKDDAGGIVAQSAGLNGAGAITISNIGNIDTKGGFAAGVLAQSLGAATAQSASGQSGATITSVPTDNFLLPFLTGKAKAGAIGISQTGNITTTGKAAHGIVAQSVSSMGAAGAVTITVDGKVDASGLDADGIQAQSDGVAASPTDPISPYPNKSATAVPNNGNIAITVSANATVSGGLGTGAAIRFQDGKDNTLLNRGTLTTQKGGRRRYRDRRQRQREFRQLRHPDRPGAVELGHQPVPQSCRRHAGGRQHPGSGWFGPGQ
jgi:hypothetical protein